MLSFLETPVGLWVKALHIVFVITWLAGLLYLPRLFVYHRGVPVFSRRSETFKGMERRLLRIILFPSAVLVWGTGIFLLVQTGHHASIWLQAKLVLVLLLSAFHGLLIYWYGQFSKDMRPHTPVFFRLANEFPTVVMILVVFLAVVRPL